MTINSQIEYEACVSWGAIGPEVFVFDESNGNIYLLKELEKEIWLSVQHNSCVSGIISEVIGKFNSGNAASGSDDKLENEILRLLERLICRGVFKCNDN